MDIKNFLRKIIRPVVYFLYYRPFRSYWCVQRNGEPLKKGITAVVAMKNEEYTLPFCLESLIGFADQVVIIDNGSSDRSLELAQDFKAKHEKEIEVDIVELPGALLGDCREAGLQRTRYQWHLRWDADMVAHTDGENNMRRLREKVLQDDTPRTLQLARLNLVGDLHHCEPHKVTDAGEPILIWFSKHVIYREFGKFDTVRVPFYYRQEQEKTFYYFHCQGLKSAENLMHRFHYFRWRELVNTVPKSQLPAYASTLESFKDARNQYLFGSLDPCTLKYRYQRQLVVLGRFTRYQPERYVYYPQVLRHHIETGQERFDIEYQDEKPFLRIDRADEMMQNYRPTDEDVQWSIESFAEKVFGKDIPS